MAGSALPADRPVILIVDDEADVRRSLVIDLESEGYRCIEAADRAQALELLKGLPRPADVALVDLALPSGPLAGIDLLRELKADPAWSSMRLLVLSARSDAETILEALRFGAIDYLTKPYEPRDLLARVGRAAGLHPTEDSSAPRSARNAEERLAVSVRTRLLAELAAPPSVEELARSVGLTPRRLNDLFRELYGDTVFGCLTEWRLEQGLALLRQGELSVKQVAYQLGYAHPSNFVAAFVRRFGDTPGHLRRQAR